MYILLVVFGKTIQRHFILDGLIYLFFHQAINVVHLNKIKKPVITKLNTPCLAVTLTVYKRFLFIKLLLLLLNLDGNYLQRTGWGEGGYDKREGGGNPQTEIGRKIENNFATLCNIYNW